MLTLKETLNKYHFFTIRHSGESRNPVETISYWMPVYTGMTVKTLLQSFLKSLLAQPQLRTFIYSLIFCLTGGLSQPTYAVFDPVNDDTDIFLANPNVPADRPNVLIYVDNTANWGGQNTNTPFVNEKPALVTVVNSLTEQFNVGLMLFVETGNPNDNQDGAYARFAIRQMTTDNKAVLASIVNNLDSIADRGNNSSTGMGMVEIYRYLTGKAEIASNVKVKTDFQNNNVFKACSSCSTTSHPSTAAGLVGYALNSGTEGALYNSPLSGSCQNNFIIYISNGELTEPVPSVNQSAAELSAASGTANVVLPVGLDNFYQGNWMDEWAKFLATVDLNGADDGAPHAITYTVEVDPAPTGGHAPDMTALMKSTAKHGKGKYFAVTSGNGGQDIVNTLLKIFTEIQAVNSVFASTTLPVSVNVRGTNLNQIYIGVFRPDAQKAPRWFGNLKMYKLGVEANAVIIVDSTGELATDSLSGFIGNKAISFWTTSSTFWSFLDSESISFGSGGASDREDGDVVEKGGAAQRLRTSFVSSQTARNLYTCTTGCDPGDLLSATPFNTSNAAITAASLDFNAFSVVSLSAFVSQTISALTDKKSVTSLNTNTSAGTPVPVTLSNGAGAGVSVTGLTNSSPTIMTALSNSPSVVTITNIARQSTKTKATITAANSYTTGDTVFIYGVTGATEYNGTWIVSSPTASNFVITNTVNFATANPPAANLANAKVATTGVIITATVPSHGFSNNQSVAINATITPAVGTSVIINSSFTITLVNANAFTFAVTSATAPYNTSASPAIGSIVSATATAPTTTATATTSTAHGFSSSDGDPGTTGDQITIDGAVPSGYNGSFEITTAGPTATTFTYTVSAGLASPATGTITASPLGLTTVTVTHTGHVFSDGDQITIAGAVPAGYNGDSTITFIDANNYSYTTSTELPANTGGSVTATPTSGISFSNTARATVSSHQFGATGATPSVLIAGAANSAYNGAFTATIVDANTFTYTVTGTPAPDGSTSITATLMSGGHPVAFATVSAHGYSNLDSITIKGATPTAYNLTAEITAANVGITWLDANTFTYVLSGVTAPQGAATGTLTASTRGTTATAKVIGHGLTTGGAVSISGASSCTTPSEFNVINKAVTVVDLNTFTYTLNNPDCDATGTITAAPSSGTTTTAVNNLINWVRGRDNNEDENVNAVLTDARASIHGDVLHSRPAVVNYNRHGNDNDVFIFYGANDGVFRAVKGGEAQSDPTELTPGQEAWGFIPVEHFTQLKRLRDNTPLISSSTKKPYFADGVIGSFVVDNNNDRKLDPADSSGDKVFLYVSMHRGGRFIYALDVTTPTAPRLLWKRTSSDTGWGELGQTWSVPQVQTINASTNPVLIFGAGYDQSVEDVDTATITSISSTGSVTGSPATTPSATGPFCTQDGVADTYTCTRTMGRGIFVVDAITGNIIWQVGPTGVDGAVTTLLNADATPYSYRTVSDMLYAIPSDLAVVSERGGSLKNRAYVGDTGGNIWRVDMDDADVANWTVTNLASIRDTSLLPSDPSGLRKFLFPPDVVYDDNSSPEFDAILIASGDREHPFETVVENRMYMFKDFGIGTTFSNFGITEADMFDATTDCAQDVNACPTPGDQADQDAALNALDDSSGWFIRLNEGEKGVGSAVTLAGVTFFNTNQPTSVANVSDTNCASDLGVARQYQVIYTNAFAPVNQNNVGDKTAADRSTIYPGGGYLPSPVPVTVEIDGKIYQVVLSGVSVVEPPAAPLGARLRKFWYKEFE